MKKYMFWEDIPLKYRGERVTTFDRLLEITGERVVEKLEIGMPPVITFDPSIETFKVKIIDMDGAEHVLETPVYALRQLTSDLMHLGDISKFIAASAKVDSQMGFGGNGELEATANISRINKIIYNIWQKTRVENSRAKKALCFKTEDIFGLNARCFATTSYKIKTDYDLLSSLDNTDMFLHSFITPVKTRATFGIKSGSEICDLATLVGFTVWNSEFKESSTGICASIFIEELGAPFYGYTTNYMGKVRHVGSNYQSRVSNMMERILGKAEEFNEWFGKKMSRADAIEIDIDKEDEFGDPLLMRELHIRSRNEYGDIIEIHRKRGLPNTVAGIALAVIDYADKRAKNDNEKDNYNKKALDIIKDPDRFGEAMNRDIEPIERRAEMIEFEFEL